MSYILGAFIVTLSYEFSRSELWVMMVFDLLENNLKFVFLTAISDTVDEYKQSGNRSLPNIISFDMFCMMAAVTRAESCMSSVSSVRCLRNRLMFWQLCKISRQTGKHVKGTSQNAQRISPTQAEGASYRVHSQFHFILNLFYIIEEFCAYLSAVVRALASHHCGLGWGSSLLLVLALFRVFFSAFSGFLLKTQRFKKDDPHGNQPGLMWLPLFILPL